MMILAPRSFRSAMIVLLSKALSAIRPPNSRPSISGSTPTVSKRWPGRRPHHGLQAIRCDRVVAAVAYGWTQAIGG